jgi:hypothetical protein
MSVVRIGVGVALFGLVAAGCSSKPTPVADETDLHDVAQTQAAVIGECPYGMVMGGAQDTTSTGKPFRSCIATQGAEQLLRMRERRRGA